jgi:hypothetical protein
VNSKFSANTIFLSKSFRPLTVFKSLGPGLRGNRQAPCVAWLVGFAPAELIAGFFAMAKTFLRSHKGRVPGFGDEEKYRLWLLVLKEAKDGFRVKQFQFKV